MPQTTRMYICRKSGSHEITVINVNYPVQLLLIDTLQLVHKGEGLALRFNVRSKQPDNFLSDLIAN